jgi:prolyl oligopeptidase
MSRRNDWVIACAALLLITGCANHPSANPNSSEVSQLSWPATRAAYPPAPRGNVVDDYHGTKVPDPYRWLEDPVSPQTKQFVVQQNSLTRADLDVPVRQRIWQRLTELWNYPRTSPPSHEVRDWVYTHNDGLQAQAVFYAQSSPDGPAHLLIDPNTLSPDGTVAVSPLAYSPDGSLIVYGVQAGGSDQMTIKIRRVDDARDLNDQLQWCKFAAVGWSPDGSGFWYNRFPTPGTVATEDETRHNAVYYHELGQKQEQDGIIYKPADRDLSAEPALTPDKRFLVLSLSHGAINKNRLYYKELNGPPSAVGQDSFVKLCDAEDAEYDLIHDVGQTFYIQTDLDAPRGRLVAVNLQDPAVSHWKTILPQGPDTLREVWPINHDQFIAVYAHDAHDIIKLFKADGTFIREVPLPGIAAVTLARAMPDDSQFFFNYTSFTTAATAMRYDLKTATLSVFHKSEVKFDSGPYVTEQIFFKSKDGTRVPMFVTHRKDIRLDGRSPALVYGYGGFNIGLGPIFTVGRGVWLEQGGVFAQVTLRGGSEYGEAWHEGGMLGNKQHVFDDMIAACQCLIDRGYTSSARLAIMGGSNGGLLTAACETQRPDLFGAVVSQVPVTDMLRYQHFTAGRFWTPEYGDAEKDAAAFAWLIKYSPLHNIHRGTVYPPTLVTTAEGDDRVVPMHARKYIATLQWADAGANPILLRTDTRSGHGGGKPTAKLIDEYADVLTFLARSLKMPFHEPPLN